MSNVFQISEHLMKPSLSLVDETFSRDLVYQYVLFIRISNDGFAFCICDQKKNKNIFLEIYSFNRSFDDDALSHQLREVFFESEQLKNLQFKSVNISVVNNCATQMPAALYEPSEAAACLQLSHPVPDGNEVKADHLQSFDVFTIYSVSSKLLQTFSSLFEKYSLKHHSTCLLESQHFQYKNISQKKLTVHVQQQNFQIILTEGRRLIFYNSFEYQSTEDFIYYILFCCEQLQLNPEEIDLVLAGEIEKDSAIYVTLYKYIRHISFANRPDVVKFSYVFDSLPSHFYYGLFSHQLCGS